MREDALYSVKTIPLEYKRLFGRDVDIFDVIELLPAVLRDCGGVPPEYIFINTKVEDFKVNLPCVYYSVMYVTTPVGYHFDLDIDRIINSGQGILINYDMESWRGTFSEANGDVVINQVSNAVKVNKNFSTKPKGRFVNYRAMGNVMEFEVTNVPVHILLSTLPVDDKGFPLVTEEVITAAAYFMNMVYCQKKYYAQQLPKYIFDDAKKDYDVKVGNALMPTSLSDNEINDMMNALSSFHRHQYTKPFGE